MARAGEYPMTRTASVAEIHLHLCSHDDLGHTHIRSLGQLEQLATELLYRLANDGARPLVYAGQGNEQLAKGLSRCGYYFMIRTKAVTKIPLHLSSFCLRSYHDDKKA